jgi:XTP/dITP diphosphohydrolase
MKSKFAKKNMKLVFATNNLHKLREVREVLGNEFEIFSTEDINCLEEIPETAPTIEGNASQKSRYVKNNYGYDCFADDTGLEIEVLNGEPGVYSARYAGKSVDFKENLIKVMNKMHGETNRKAQFKTVISLILNGNEYLFEGIVKGRISDKSEGNSGFGYDPVFIPDGFDISYAQMTPELKNSISHRGIAVRKLVEFLRSLA